MSLIIRLAIGALIWAVISTFALIIQPRLNIGNWEAFVFPAVTSLLGLMLVWGAQTAIVARLVTLAIFCVAVGFFHLWSIKYFYVQQSEFIHEKNWPEYYQAFIFIGITSFLIAAVIFGIGQLFALRERL